MNLIPILWFLFYSLPDGAVKINGVSLVSPPRPIDAGKLVPVIESNANWITIIPYSFMPSGETKIQTHNKWQWWGESPEGTRELVKMAKSTGLKVMLKPHLWIGRGEFTGDLQFKTEKEWLEWEKSYADYVLLHAAIAESLKADLFCIGNELKSPVLKRPAFFLSLIQSVRKIYKGPVTYGANWDEYPVVTFWNKLDFIGINAYFPLHPAPTPHADTLKESWKPILSDIQTISQKFRKPVLFTEFGYRSMNQAAWKNWELDQLPRDKRTVNLKAQIIGYESFFQTFWNKSWVAGGFLWKWYPDEAAGGENNTDWTPQGKPVMKTIRQFYTDTAGLKK